MAAIIEDYVSFEIAKLLKKKGFDEDCTQWYEVVFDELELIEENEYTGHQTNSDHTSPNFECAAPTLQMAMKWLREVHDIHITIDCDICDSFDFYSIIRIKSEESWKTYVEYEDEGSNTCEEAAEKAVKYCLTNLI